MDIKTGVVQVPMVAIIGYAAFVVVASLLVGILPAVVNLPECKDDALDAPAVYEILKKENKFEAIPELLARLEHGHPAKRFAEPELSQLPEMPKEVAKPSKKALREQSKQRARQLSSQALLEARFGKKARIDLPKCPEADLADQSTFPWASYRLPDTLSPSAYDITIDIGGFTDAFNLYSGQSIITIDVAKPTQFIMLNVRFDDIRDTLLNSLKDKNGVDIAVECAFITDEYYVLKTTASLTVAQSPITLDMSYANDLERYESGIFKIKYNEGFDESALIMTKFQPIDAREAYPCFDEPRFKATYKLTINHPAGSTALSNTPGTRVVNGANAKTTFAVTPKMPSYLIGFTVFQDKDFTMKTKKSASGKDINFWANKDLVAEGYVDGPLDMVTKFFDAYENELFKNVPGGAPPKIDVFASPDYPTDGISHFGFPVFKENKVLFQAKTQSERNKQDVAFLFAKALSEFWFGNYVTMEWWDELWLQEALSNYVKYKIFEYAYPLIPIDEQFSVEEMIYVLFEDAYPSSHPVVKPSVTTPYEIEGYFDIVETSKATAILRMAEYELAAGAMTAAFENYLNKNAWGTGKSQDLFDAIGQIRGWNARDFFDRWFKQSNYPYVKLTLEKSGGQTFLNAEQMRHINSPGSIFADVVLYPSPYNWTWYVPLNCYFGETPDDQNPIEREFNLDTKTARFTINNPNNKDLNWVYCNLEFYGYFLAEYTVDNWVHLANALKGDNNMLEPLDRVAILNDVFANAFTERETYYTAVSILDYIQKENDYLPWRAVYKYIKDLTSVLQYRKTFYQVSKYVGRMLEDFNITSIWMSDETDVDPNPDKKLSRTSRFIDNHISNLWRETIVRLGTELQVKSYLEKASSYWDVAEDELETGTFKDDLPPFIRASVYDFHLQNTYKIQDWDILYRIYELTDDFNEERRLLEALTYPRLPWLLAKFLESFEKNLFRQFDFFDVVDKMSKNPLGREIVWDYVRINRDYLITTYSLEDLRLGQMIIDISENFENDFLLGELIQYVFTTPAGASQEAYFQSLEIVSANVQWLKDNEKDIEEAFGGERSINFESVSHFKLSPEHQFMLEEIYKRAGRPYVPK